MYSKYCLFILLMLASSLAVSQTDSLSTDIDEILIQENRISLPFKNSSRSITVIDRAQIELSAAKDIAELLQQVAGVDVRQRGVHGVQSDIGIRGGTFEQTLILVNGIKLIDAQTGHHNMNVPVNINIIERIEILKGPAARIYGQNGFSGAINIITKKAEKNQIDFGVSYGEHNTLGLSVTEAIATENSSHIISLNRNTSDGYKYNTDYKVENIFYQNHLQLGKQKLMLSIGHSWRNFGANGFYASPDFMDQYEEITTTLASVGAQLNYGDWLVKPRFSYRKNKDRYLFVRDNPAIYENNHQSDHLAAELNASKVNDLGVLGIGVEWNRFLLESNNLGERERDLFSIAIEQRFNLMDGALDITPGVSYTSYSDYDNKFFPGVDIGYTISNALKAYANYGFTYRVPSFTDRFYTDPANAGNPDLAPEEAVSYELGVKYSEGNIRASAAYFVRDGKDLIDWVRDADTLQWTPINIGEIQTSGLELALNYNFKAVDYLDQISLGYTIINAEQSNVDAPLSRYALEHLNNQFVAGFNWHVGDFKHSLHYRALDRENLDAYSVLDTKLMYDTKKVEVALSITNLFDTQYQETNLVTMPGRWIIAGVKYKLEY